MTTPPPLNKEQFSLSSKSYRIAPPPISTGSIAILTETDIAHVTDTTLDCGKVTYWDMENRIRIMIASLFSVLIFINLLLINDPRHTFSISIFLSCSLFISGILFCVVINTYYYVANNKTPLRFNREKREVFYQKGNECYIADWETVQVNAETTSPLFQYYSVPSASLRFVIQDKYTHEKSSIRFYYPFMLLAVAEWELIRTYMDEGVDKLNEKSHSHLQRLKEKIPHLNQEEREKLQEYFDKRECPKGSLGYFELTKRQARDKGRLFSCFWHLYHVITFWKMPCYVVTWLNEHPKIYRSYQMIDWSKPTSEEQ